MRPKLNTFVGIVEHEREPQGRDQARRGWLAGFFFLVEIDDGY